MGNPGFWIPTQSFKEEGLGSYGCRVLKLRLLEGGKFRGFPQPPGFRVCSLLGFRLLCFGRERVSTLGTPEPENPKPQPLNLKPPNPKPQTPNPKPQTPNPKPQTPNPKPQTLNPKPPRKISCQEYRYYLLEPLERACQHFDLLEN